MFLVFRQNPLLFASELIETLRFNDLAITRGMDVLSNCIKHKFAHDVAQLTMLASISVDENEIALGFKQGSNVRDLAIEHMHVCIGQNQRIKSILPSSLERFLINESTLFLSCSNHVHRRQILISHGTRPLHFDEQIHGYKFRGKCQVRGVNLSWTRFANLHGIFVARQMEFNDFQQLLHVCPVTSCFQCFNVSTLCPLQSHHLCNSLPRSFEVQLCCRELSKNCI